MSSNKLSDSDTNPDRASSASISTSDEHPLRFCIHCTQETKHGPRNY